MEAIQEEPANACCAALSEQFVKQNLEFEEMKSKFLEMYSKCVEKLSGLEEKMSELEKSHSNHAEKVSRLEDKMSKLDDKYLNLQVTSNKLRESTVLVQRKYLVIEKENESLRLVLMDLKDEKEREYGVRVELEDKVSALTDEIQLLKHIANAERKSAEENRFLWEKSKMETDALKKSMLDSERCKSEVIRKRKREDLEVAVKAEQGRELGETNLKKAVFEKDDREDDDLNRKYA